MFAHVGAISIGSSIYPNMPLDPVDDPELHLGGRHLRRWSGRSPRRCPSRRCRSSSPRCRRNRATGAMACRLPAASRIWSRKITKIRHKLDMPRRALLQHAASLVAVISGEVPITVDSLGASAGHIAGGSCAAGDHHSRRAFGAPARQCRPCSSSASIRANGWPGMPSWRPMNTGRDHPEAEHRDQSGA